MMVNKLVLEALITQCGTNEHILKSSCFCTWAVEYKTYRQWKEKEKISKLE